MAKYTYFNQLWDKEYNNKTHGSDSEIVLDIICNTDNDDFLTCYNKVLAYFKFVSVYVINLSEFKPITPEEAYKYDMETSFNAVANIVCEFYMDQLVDHVDLCGGWNNNDLCIKAHVGVEGTTFAMLLDENYDWGNQCAVCYGNGFIDGGDPCPDCEGTGLKPDNICFTCKELLTNSQCFPIEGGETYCETCHDIVVLKQLLKDYRDNIITNCAVDLENVYGDNCAVIAIERVDKAIKLITGYL